ncbi:hypothetical protein PENARI_c005G09013 [Penicillium arizonense]|uniref:Uncharacterized protein n=1 Tax=Penicillium arizonense TaxID=1835702 RepID=A0A1F5LNP1_PENAI|nr:hypothetical protein PENARI_c005G09013 [Penicillium arizonense]OGE54745.1 hypothetical protein PENARI_c005G09013 [Penicillium arizonense]
MPCLGVAVDHRIRRLFKPVCNDLTEPSNHVSLIETRGQSLERPHSEIQVTAQLAGPAFKGGIAVALQQPRHNHPFEEGLDAVIRDCKTLYALDDVFAAVSCGSLDIRTNVTIVDLLPYVSESIASIDGAILEESFRASKHIMLDKEPSVLLCAGKIRLSNTEQFRKRKGDASKLGSIEVGKKFGHIPKYPVEAKIHCEGNRGFVTIRRVNGFHPSYAMNYHPHVSCLRQLQIMIGAETCGMLRDDWEEEDWMGELRRRCKDVSEAPSESPSQSPQSQSSGESSTKRNNTKYLPDYQELYSDKLLSIHRCVQSLISEPIPAVNSSTALYKPLLTCGLSEIFNDVTLILRQMSRLRLRSKGWPKYVASINKAALKQAAIDTRRFTVDLKATEPSKNAQFAEIIQKGASVLSEIIMRRDGWPLEDRLDFNETSEAFLNIATNIETLLMDLLLEEERDLHALGQEQTLSIKMGRMTLAPVLN